MMRSGLLRFALFSLPGLACAPTTVDFSALRGAADARQRQAGLNRRPLSKDVRALLAQPLTADSASEVALQNNRGVRAAAEQLGIAQSTLVHARRLPNPTAEAALRFGGEGDPEIEVSGMIDVTELVFLLPRGGAVEAQVEAARLFAIGAILDLSFEARRAFYEHQGALQALDLRRTALQALSAAAEAAAQLRSAGNITALDAANQQSAFEEARLSFQRAETEIAKTRERLNAVLGLWGRATDWTVAPRLPDPPAQELPVATLESEAIARSLELAVTRQRFTAAARRANVASASGWIPELKAGVSAERDEAWSVGPAVELEVPLFYQGQGEVGQARAEMRQQQNVHADTAIRLRAKAREVATRLSAAREAARYYRDTLLPLKQKIVEETQLQYNAMMVGVFQLLQARRDQVETAGRYVEQLREYWTLRTTAEELLAGRLGADVSSPEMADPSLGRAFGSGQDPH